MLMEVVAFTLTVLSTIQALPAQPQSTVMSSSDSLVSTIPEKQLLAMLSQPADEKAFMETTLPDEQIIALVASPIPMITETPTMTPTPTDTPTPTPTEVITPTPTIQPTAIPTPTPTQAVQPVATSTDIDGYFEKYSKEHNVDKELLRRIASCESGYNSQARNGNYGGMYQFAESTWSTVRSRMGQDQNPDLRFQAEEAIKTAAYYINNGGQSAWPNC